VNSRDEVRELIFGAFGNLEKPSGRDVAPHDCDECDEVRKRLAPHNFSDVPDVDLDWLRDTIPLLGPKGLQFYLPAYLLRMLREPEWGGVEQLMLNLNPALDAEPRSAQYWKERLQIFNFDQRTAVLRFLDWLETSSVGPEYYADIIGARDVWTRMPLDQFPK
jgi:hypothetical protein